MFKKKAFGILIALYILFSSNYNIYSVEASNMPVSKKTAKEDVQETDFGPYMKDLQQAIKKNWIPPKGKESKHVVVAFSIARDGRLLNLNIKNSSGNKEVDERAIKAVKLTFPFKALPSDFKGDKVDIHFTFDYKVSQISTKYDSSSYNDVENLVQYL